MINYKYTILASAILLISAWGCKTAEKIYTANDYGFPNDYLGHVDSKSAASLAVNEFFTDKTLVALIDTALSQNADIHIAMQKVKMAKANLLLNKGAMLPSIDINIYSSANRYGKYTMNGVGNSQSPEIPYPVTPEYYAGLASSWEIDVWGKLRNKKKAAQLRYLSSNAGKNYLVTTLLSEVAYRYYTLASLDDELIIIRKNIKLQESALEIVRLQKEGGRATELAVKQFVAQLVKTQSIEYQVRQDIFTTENELNFLIGRYPHKIERSTDSFTLEQLNSLSTGIPSDLLQNRQDIVQAELELKASHADIASARAAFLPSFNLGANVGYNAYNATVLFNPASIAFGLIGNLSNPVLNKNAIKANYDLTIAGHKVAYYQYGRTVMNAIYEVISNIQTIDNLKSQYALNENEAVALNEAVMISNDLYVAGYANYLEVITAQKNALEAELNVVRTRRKIQFSTINLYRSLGGGWK